MSADDERSAEALVREFLSGGTVPAHVEDEGPEYLEND